MAGINDFVETPEYSIEDFTDPSAVPVPVTSLGSDRSSAAHAAMLSPDPSNAVNAYDQIVGERASTGYSDTEETLVTNARGENMVAYQRSTAELLMDPSASQEWKQAAIGIVNDPNSHLYDPRNMVATKAATQDVKGETAESAIQRGVAAAGINEVLEYQREKQKYYNSMQLTSDKDKTADYVAAAEGFIPLASGYKEARITRDLAGDDWNGFKTAMATVFNGSTVKDRNEMFNKLPISQRMQMMDKVADIIAADGQTIFLPSSKDNVNLKAFMQTVESDGYSTTEETIDNILGVLDFAGVGAMVKKGVSYVGALGKLAGETESVSDTFRNVVRTNVVTDVQPASLHNTIKDVNPEMGRGLYNATLADESGELATAVYGTSREDALASVVVPKPASVDGTVTNAVTHPERNSDFQFMPDADILDFVDNSGAAWLTPAEKRVLRSSVVNDFRNTVGMRNKKEMGSVEALPDGVKFSSVYGPTDSGWSGLQDAIDQAQFALKNYGITEKDISVLIRQGENYVPLDKKVQATLLANNNAQIKGDFLLQIDHTYRYDSSKLGDGFEFLDVRNNGFDRWLPWSGTKEQGTLQSNVLDPQSMLNPKLTKGATIAGLRGAGLEQKLLQNATDYVESINKLPSERQDKIFSKIRENNAKGQGLNYANLKAEGFSDAEVDALRKWQSNQDTLYAISNRDMIKTYTARGYGLMEHQDSGTRLIVRPVARNQTGDRVKAFDPLNNSVVDLDSKALTDLYAGNGNIAKAISPISVDGVQVEHVLNRNAAGSTYIRQLRNDDQVLNYRKGYYAVRYRDPHFIEKKVVDADGKPILDSSGKEQWKAVATASDIPKAKKAVERLTSANGGEYRYRNDLKGEEYDNATHSVLQTGGMSSQRLRGERLEEAIGDNQLLQDGTHIESPIESMVHAMQSVSSRVSARDWIETAKQRFIAQFGEVLPKQQGRTVYPATRNEIGEAGQKTSKMAADARTTWEYIRAMEDGYKNSLDDGAKALLNGIAEWMGHKGFGFGERTLRGAAGQADITGKLKGAAFTMYLAANPLRQFLVQSHQVLMLASINPRYVFTQLVDDLSLVMAYHAGAKPSPALLKAAGRTEAEAEVMFNALKQSNIGAGITKNELVNESINSIVDEASAFARSSNKIAKYTVRPLQKAVGLSRKVGFDFGEYISSASAFLTEYEKVARTGAKIDAATIEEITTRSRNFVYNMDRAGALPYNHNSAAIVTQFLQVPHKAILQFTYNRGLSANEKGRILGYMLTMFGTTSVGMGSIVESYTRDLLPEDPTYREALVNGLETVVLNKVFSDLYGEQVNLDYSSLAPLDVYGVSEFLQSVIGEGPLQVFASSPAGSLIMGSNPRVANLLNTAATMVGLKDPAEGMDPPSWSNLAKDSANLFSGLSNAFKAAYAYEYGQKLGALGGVTDSNVNKFEAIATALGLPTQDETKYRKAMEATYKNDKEIEKDVKEIFRITSQRMAQDGITAQEYEYAAKMMGIGMATFKNNPKAMQYWKGEMKKQSTNRDDKFIRQMMDYSGWGTPDKVKSLIDNAPLDADRKEKLRSFVDYNLENRQDIKE